MNELDQIKELHDMLNIGLGFEKDLKKVGINTPDELRKVGSKEAFLRLTRGGVQKLNLNKLAALEGAIRNVKKYALDESTREDMDEFYMTYEL